MRITLKGNIKRTYVQTLCMMFFHGEKFPEKETQGEQNHLSVEATENEKGIECKAVLTYNGVTAFGEGFADFTEYESYDRTSKTAVGQAVYRAGVALTEREIPWGILTGIRPSIIATELLLRYGYSEAKYILTDRYLLSSEKAELALIVGKNESDIISRYNENDCSLYISIPFCPSRCSYCSFISYATKKLFSILPAYLDKLISELRWTLKLIKESNKRLATVYIGGGTPTVLSPEQLDSILSVLSEGCDLSQLDEFTVECGRPDTITKEKLSVLKRYNVTRVSVNPQTLNDEVLEKIGRKHTVNDFFDAYNQVKATSSWQINTDLIVGLEGDCKDSFKSTIDKIIALSPCNVTLHALCIKKSAQILADNASVYQNKSDYATEGALYAYKRLTECGYIPYYMYRQKNTVSDLENVGYAKKDTFGIYNVLMMSDKHTIFSCGAGATTKILTKNGDKTEINRIFSPKYPYEYLEDEQDKETLIYEYMKGGTLNEKNRC